MSFKKEGNYLKPFHRVTVTCPGIASQHNKGLVGESVIVNYQIFR